MRRSDHVREVELSTCLVLLVWNTNEVLVAQKSRVTLKIEAHFDV